MCSSFVRPTGFEPVTLALAYRYSFRYFAFYLKQICGLDYLFTISGATRIVSTDPHFVMFKVF